MSRTFSPYDNVSRERNTPSYNSGHVAGCLGNSGNTNSSPKSRPNFPSSLSTRRFRSSDSSNSLKARNLTVSISDHNLKRVQNRPDVPQPQPVSPANINKNMKTQGSTSSSTNPANPPPTSASTKSLPN